MISEKRKVGRKSIGLPNAERVLFRRDGITKRDLAGYYRGVAGQMLPLLRDRPVSMTYFLDGITAPGVVQRCVPAHFPDWITRAQIAAEDGPLEQVICDKPATLMYLAGQGCIELGCFLSRLGQLREPDQLIFDLDPPDGRRFDDVRVCALRLGELLSDELGLPTFVKTTGGNGLHVHVPLTEGEEFGAARAFARQVTGLLAVRHPDLVTAEQRKRGRRIYADVTRNAYAQFVVAPYSVRARTGAPVATPLSWDEVEDKDLSPDQFTLRTLPDRVRESRPTAGPWAGMARRRTGLARARAALRRLAG
jgi:bifunctional non-homologous end joining protein LigD